MLARKKSGFTLIELLVVIAIIAILAAILFPVFARARESARKSTCQSNMKECAIAIHTYWGDYDSTLPSSAIHWDTALVDPAFTDARYQTFGTKIGTLPPQVGVVNANPTWAMVLYNHLKSRDIMFCPSDSVDKTSTGSAISYWWKYALDVAWSDVNLRCQKESDFAFNSDQVIFHEHLGWHFGDTNGLKDGIQINCAYLDSHVKTHSLKGTPFATTSSTYIVTATSCPTPSSFQGEPFYFNFYGGDDSAKQTSFGKVGKAGAFYNPREYCDKF